MGLQPHSQGEALNGVGAATATAAGSPSGSGSRSSSKISHSHSHSASAAAAAAAVLAPRTPRGSHTRTHVLGIASRLEERHRSALAQQAAANPPKKKGIFKQAFSRRSRRDSGQTKSMSFPSNDPVNLHLVLRRDSGLELFREHLKQEFSVENLLFWEGVNSFRGDFKAETPSQNLNRAAELYRNFVEPGAPQQVNFDHHVVKQVGKAIKARKIERDMFNEAQHLVYVLMSRDSFVRFQQEQQKKPSASSKEHSTSSAPEEKPLSFNEKMAAHLEVQLPTNSAMSFNEKMARHLETQLHSPTNSSRSSSRSHSSTNVVAESSPRASRSLAGTSPPTPSSSLSSGTSKNLSRSVAPTKRRPTRSAFSPAASPRTSRTRTRTSGRSPRSTTVDPPLSTSSPSGSPMSSFDSFLKRSRSPLRSAAASSGASTSRRSRASSRGPVKRQTRAPPLGRVGRSSSMTEI